MSAACPSGGPGGGPLPAPVVARSRVSGSASVGACPSVRPVPSTLWLCCLSLEGHLSHWVRSQTDGVCKGPTSVRITCTGTRVQDWNGLSGKYRSTCPGGMWTQLQRWPVPPLAWGACPRRGHLCVALGSQLTTLPSLALTREGVMGRSWRSTFCLRKARETPTIPMGRPLGPGQTGSSPRLKSRHKGKGLANNRRCRPRPP